MDEVIIYCVNDGAVMKAWSEDQGVGEDNSMITLMADPTADVTAALDMQLIDDGPIGKGLINRCKRFALYVVDGEVKIVRIAEKMGDPAGDDFPEDTLPEAMIVAIKALGGGEL